MQILTHCWEAEEVATELTEVLQFNKFIGWILKFKMLSLSFKLSMYDLFAPRFLWRVRACEPGQLRRHRRQSAISVSRWTLTHLQGFISFCLRSIVESDIIATIFSGLFLPNQLDIFFLVRLSALEDSAGVDYSYNNYEHAAAASDHNSDVVSYGTWTKRQTRLNKTAAKFCHFTTLFKRHSSQLKQS